MLQTLEHSFQCPYCGEIISMLLDPALSGQFFIEDCEVCCRPIRIYFELSAEELESFQVNRAQ